MVRSLLSLLTPPRLAFGGSASPPPVQPVPPPPPMQQQPQGAQASDDAQKRAQAAQGFGSTILTGPMGDTGQPNLARKSLLGD